MMLGGGMKWINENALNCSLNFEIYIHTLNSFKKYVQYTWKDYIGQY